MPLEDSGREASIYSYFIMQNVFSSHTHGADTDKPYLSYCAPQAIFEYLEQGLGLS